MIRTFCIYLSFIFFTSSAHADTVCMNVEEIKNSVSDEICLAISNEAKACFAKLNFQLQAFQKFSKTLSKKNRKMEAEGLLQVHQEAISQLSGSYTEEMNRDEGACKYNNAELKVWIEELNKDLKELQFLTKK